MEAKNFLLVFTDHCFRRYAQRILISDAIYKQKLEKIYGSQYWLEHIMLADLLHSESVVGEKEEKITRDFHRGGNAISWAENYGKGWTYYDSITGNVFICAREAPYLVALTCFKYDIGKALMNPSKWFYNNGSNSIVYKNYFTKAKGIMHEYGIKSFDYKCPGGIAEIGYLK